MGYKGRDVEVVFINEEQCIVAACDSCGAIGSKELDEVKVPWYITGRFTTRVALLEVLSIGASPQMLTVAISAEPFPAGEEILKGVRDELNSNNIASLPIAISTEKNMPTKQTGLGISVVGLCERLDLRIAISKPGDIVYCLGLPKVGEEAKDPDASDFIQGKHIEVLLNHKGIHDIVPIGSKGILGEVELLAANVNCKFEQGYQGEVNLEKTGGPSTSLVFTAPEDMEIPDFSPTPCFIIGRLI